MIVDLKKLKAAMFLAGFTQVSLAVELGISKNALSLKMTGQRPFTLSEASKLCKLLHIEDNNEKAAIFLN